MWLVLAAGLKREGRREVLGVDVITCEDEYGWEAFLRSLKERGLGGVQLLISDAHSRLKKALASVFPGASWQRCRVHFLKNLLCRIPKCYQERVVDLVCSIFAQPSAATARLQLTEERGGPAGEGSPRCGRDAAGSLRRHSGLRDVSEGTLEEDLV